MQDLTGKHLNDMWGVGAKHALYSEDGKWYHRLLAFPGALFDANGYVVFHTEQDYRECPDLQIGREVSVPAGIASMADYVRITEYGQLQVFSHKIRDARQKKDPAARARKRPPYRSKMPLAADMPLGNEEVMRALGETYRIIRDTRVSKWIMYLHGYKCQICGETVQLLDGEFYAEAHHLQPLGGEHNGPDVVENVICVCPRHHVLLDYGVIALRKAQLRMIPGHEIGEAYIAYHNALRGKRK